MPIHNYHVPVPMTATKITIYNVSSTRCRVSLKERKNKYFENGMYLGPGKHIICFCNIPDDAKNDLKVHLPQGTHQLILKKQTSLEVIIVIQARQASALRLDLQAAKIVEQNLFDESDRKVLKNRPMPSYIQQMFNETHVKYMMGYLQSTGCGAWIKNTCRCYDVMLENADYLCLSGSRYYRLSLPPSAEFLSHYKPF
jgi:hypothetical protein